ncbi:MAG: rod shape-determining protein RodA [Saprospiraceae bacterium]
MRNNQPSYLQNTDFITFSIYLALVAIGGIFVYSVDIQQSAPPDGLADFLLHTLAGKQVIWIGISLMAMSFILFVVDDKVWQVFAYLFYALGIIGLVAVLFFGKTINGATSWFSIGGSTFQPSELAKFGTCLAIASYLGHWSVDMRHARQFLIVSVFFMVPVVLVLLQPDAGSALVFLSFFIVLFREGLSPLLYVIGFVSAATFVVSILFPSTSVVAGLAWIVSLLYILQEKNNLPRWLLGLTVLGIAIVWLFQNEQVWIALALALTGVLLLSWRQYTHFRAHLIPVMLSGFVLTAGLAVGSSYVFNNVLKPHQQQRIDVWLRPAEAKKRNKDSVMNLENSMLAIGAGGLTGRGLFSGRMTQGRWVPEQDTDFIFCTIGEEQGFIGSAAVVILYLLLLLRIVMIAERQRVAFNRIYAYGVAGILFVHFIVNIGMTIGLLPIIGIPLPFVSKGGSSLLGFTIMMAVLLKLDRHRGRAKKGPLGV